jgi:hypothetical protein
MQQFSSLLYWRLFTAVIDLLTMSGETPETCWAVNKRQDNKLENCCIWLMIYLNNLRNQLGDIAVLSTQSNYLS